MSQDINTIINNIKSFDLSKYPHREILEEIKKIGIIGHVCVQLHQGYPIYRARPNYGEERYKSKCELTYKPSHLNKTCQRASLSGASMFYGSILPEKIVEGDLDDARVAPIYEAVPWFRNKTTKGIRKVTFTKWEVTSTLKLIAIVQHESFQNKNSYIRELMGKYDEFLAKNIDRKSDGMVFCNFLAGEFAKEVFDNDFEYLISATFSKHLLDNGLDGVIYPSVKLQGAGLNIALKPEAADSKLQLKIALECTGYKLRDIAVLDNDYHAILYPNQTHFDYEKIEGEDHGGIEECLEQLGINSIDELTENN